MGCAKIFPVNLKEDDTPIDSAIFSAANNAIYGVRGQWVYKFNATTGRKESEAVVKNDALGLTSICEHAGVIYVSVCWTQQFDGGSTWRGHDLYSINPTTLAATDTLIWKTYKASSDPAINSAIFGPIQIISDGGSLIWGLIADGTNFAPFFVNPAAPAGLKQESANNWTRGAGAAGGEIIYDTVNSVAIYANAESQTIDCWNTSGGFPPTSVGGMNAFSLYPEGLCYCPSNDNIYAVDGTSILISASVSDMLSIGGTNVPINTGEATANPRRIKYCALNGKILVPGWASNSVITINPATNAVVSTQTGFSLPWDVVVTNAKAFAVQNSSVGLREITL